MQISSTIVKQVFFSLLALFLVNSASAQVTVSQARQYAADKNYDKAFEAYGELYGLSPDSVYTEYLNTLLAAKKYQKAEKLVEKQMTLRDNPYLHIDMGKVYAKEGKDVKAKEEYEVLLKRINGDDMFTTRLANAFHNAGLDEYAIATYERATQIINIPYYYCVPLANLYAKNGAIDKAVDILLIGNPNPYLPVDNVKSILLEILNNDPEKLQLAQKEIIKKINAQPDNTFYVELLTWVYTQKNDWGGALIQIEAIDERNHEHGRRLMDLARTATFAKQYETAVKAYDEIIAQGRELPYYVNARIEKMSSAFQRIKSNPAYTKEEVSTLANLYDSFLVEYPKHYCMQTGADFAQLQAQYNGNVPRAIDILKKGIADPDVKRNMVGTLKLQLGDYYVLVGHLWEASLTYSQVDKEFKQDAFGEDARFRNAKLAYYRGDFDWAQHQLNVLKSATSELIANDAIYLSVLITENVEDSNLVPLQRFATVGLLLFQNKDKEAEALLDSINKAYPKHPLNDDILMQRAEIARKHREFDKALGYLKTIHEQYGQDVLGDDAVFKMAEIYQNDLHQNDQAKHYYEQLIIEYNGSTYVQSARARLYELNNAATP